MVRGHIAGDQRLQRADNLSDDDNRIVTFMRPGGVAAGTGEGDGETIHAGGQGAVLTADRADGKRRIVMDAENHGGIVQRTGGDQRRRTVAGLFRGLKQDTYGAGKRRFLRFK